MMKKNGKTLAIDPGTRYMGVALISNGKLLYQGVEVFGRGNCPHQTLQACRKAVLRLVKDYRPRVVIVEKTFFANNRSASLLNVLFDEIKAIARRKRLKFLSY